MGICPSLGHCVCRDGIGRGRGRGSVGSGKQDVADGAGKCGWDGASSTLWSPPLPACAPSASRHLSQRTRLGMTTQPHHPTTQAGMLSPYESSRPLSHFMHEESPAPRGKMSCLRSSSQLGTEEQLESDSPDFPICELFLGLG